MSRRVVGPPFTAFAGVACASNIASAAVTTIILWLVGDLRLSAATPLVQQLSIAAAAFAGTWLGASLARSRGASAGVIITSCLQVGVALVTVATVSFGPTDGQQRALAIIGCSTLMAFLFSVGGASWIMLVHEWPSAESGSGERRILQDSVQFQIGRFLGPLAGGQALLHLRAPLATVAVLDALTFLGVSVVVRFTKRAVAANPLPEIPSAGEADRRTAVRAVLTSPPLILAGVLALSVDGARAYLARLIRMSGGSETTFTQTLAAIAMAAALTGIAASRRPDLGGDRVNRQTLGAGASAAALIAWLFAPSAHLLWPTGGLLAGAGFTLANASITAALMDRPSSEKPQAVAILNSSRIGASSIGALMVMLSISLGLPALLFPALLLVVAIATRRSKRIRASRA